MSWPFRTELANTGDIKVIFNNISNFHRLFKLTLKLLGFRTYFGLNILLSVWKKLYTYLGRKHDFLFRNEQNCQNSTTGIHHITLLHFASKSTNWACASLEPFICTWITGRTKKNMIFCEKKTVPRANFGVWPWTMYFDPFFGFFETFQASKDPSRSVKTFVRRFTNLIDTKNSDTRSNFRWKSHILCHFLTKNNFFWNFSWKNYFFKPQTRYKFFPLSN